MDVYAITQELGVEMKGPGSPLESQSPGKRKALCSLKNTVKDGEQ